MLAMTSPPTPDNSTSCIEAQTNEVAVEKTNVTAISKDESVNVSSPLVSAEIALEDEKSEEGDNVASAGLPSDEITALIMSLQEYIRAGDEVLANEEETVDTLSAAADYYSQALQIQVRLANDDHLAPACGPAYARYGHVLLKLAIKLGSDRLLNQEIVPEQMMEPIAKDRTNAGKRRVFAFEDEGQEGEEDEDDDGEGEEGEDEDQEGNTSGDPGHSAQNDAASTQQAEEKQQQQPGNEEEDDDEFALAWEALDVARVIYAKASTTDIASQQQLCNVLQDLADLSMEVENFSQAIPDYQQSINVQNSIIALKKSINESGDEDLVANRALAATYFKLAMAIEYSGKPADAIEPLTTARTILKRCAEVLDQQRFSKDKGKDIVTETNGVDPDDLLALLPEVDAKVQDLKAAATSASNAGDGSSSDRNAENGEKAKVVHDLTSLIRKRKVSSGNEQSSNSTAEEAKQLKQDNVSEDTSK